MHNKPCKLKVLLDLIKHRMEDHKNLAFLQNWKEHIIWALLLVRVQRKIVWLWDRSKLMQLVLLLSLRVLLQDAVTSNLASKLLTMHVMLVVLKSTKLFSKNSSLLLLSAQVWNALRIKSKDNLFSKWKQANSLVSKISKSKNLLIKFQSVMCQGSWELLLEDQ